MIECPTIDHLLDKVLRSKRWGFLRVWFRDFRPLFLDRVWTTTIYLNWWTMHIGKPETFERRWKRQVYLSMKFGRWLEWRIGSNGRTDRNLPTGTDHLPDHSIPTSCVVPGIQTCDHLRIRDCRIYWTLCTVNFRIGLHGPIPLW